MLQSGAMTGIELRERRQSLGFTQQKLAQRLGISRNKVGQWERSEIPIPVYLDLALQSIERVEPSKPFVEIDLTVESEATERQSFKAKRRKGNSWKKSRLR